MRYKLLGNSGLRVSELALGTMTFGDENGPGVADEKASRELFDAFLEAGGNFIDTATANFMGRGCHRLLCERTLSGSLKRKGPRPQSRATSPTPRPSRC